MLLLQGRGVGDLSIPLAFRGISFKFSSGSNYILKIYLFIHNYLCVLGESTTPHPSFPPNLCLYVNLGAKGAQKLFKTLAPQLTVLGIPHFC
jgi:hypothetical protein